MKIWIDTAGCDESFHVLTTGDDGSDVRHADGSECDDMEFQFTEDDSQ